jgi:hypothetical protein
MGHGDKTLEKCYTVKVPQDQSGVMGHGDKTLEKCYKVKVPQDQSGVMGHGDKTMEKCYKVKVPHDKTLCRCPKIRLWKSSTVQGKKHAGRTRLVPVSWRPDSEKVLQYKTIVLVELEYVRVMETRLGTGLTKENFLFGRPKLFSDNFFPPWRTVGT